MLQQPLTVPMDRPARSDLENPIKEMLGRELGVVDPIEGKDRVCIV